MTDQSSQENSLGQSAANGEPLKFGHKISGGDFVGLGFINTILGIVTLTLYRFWARTNVRKQIWRSIYMNDEAFEYTGTGGELFKGFLIALLVITLPYLILVFGAQMMPPLIGGAMFIAFLLFIYLLIGAAIWLAFRYLASRTVWRGIRFSMKGNPKNFSFMYFGQLLLTGITLGWWSPKMELKVAEGLWGGMHFGNMPFKFNSENAKDANLFSKFAIGWVATFIGYLVLISMFFSSFGALDAGMNSTDPNDIANTFGLLGRIYLALFVFMIVVLFAFMPYRAAVLKAIASCITLDGAKFKMDIKWTDLALLWVVNLIILVFSLGILMPVAQARTARFLINNLKSEGNIDLAKAEQAEAGPDQAEGLSDAFDIGII